MKLLRHFLTQRQLDAFTDGELDDHFATSVLFHLDECVDCVTELELIIWTKTALAQHGAAEFGGPTGAAADAVARLETWALTEVLNLS